MNNKSYKLGFSLVELVVVVAIMGIVSLLGLRSLQRTIVTGGKSQVVNSVRENGDYAITEIERILRSATEVTHIGATYLANARCPNTAITGDGITLKLQDNLYSAISFSNNNITVNGNEILSENVRITSLKFSCSQPDFAAATVSVRLTISQGDSRQQNEYLNETFQTTVKLRSY